MARACWRCVEPIEDTATRCPSCGVRIVPLSSEPSPLATARKIRMAILLLIVATGGLIAWVL
ncbi:MAG: hypothetical protein U1E64_13710 [Sphingomonadaceae bacterium]